NQQVRALAADPRWPGMPPMRTQRRQPRVLSVWVSWQNDRYQFRSEWRLNKTASAFYRRGAAAAMLRRYSITAKRYFPLQLTRPSGGPDKPQAEGIPPPSSARRST